MTGSIYNGIVSRYLNRRFSVPMAKGLSHTPVTPNQVSIVSLALALAAMWLYIVGSYIGGGIMAQVSSIVDGVDGDLARTKGMASRFGGFLDAVLDRYADAVIILGLTIWAASTNDSVYVWVAGFLALTGSLVTSYTRARIQGVPQGFFDRGIVSLASRDVRLFLIMLGSIAGQGLVTLVLIAGLTNTVVLLRLLEARRVMTNAGSGM